MSYVVAFTYVIAWLASSVDYFWLLGIHYLHCLPCVSLLTCPEFLTALEHPKFILNLKSTHLSRYFSKELLSSLDSVILLGQLCKYLKVGFSTYPCFSFCCCSWGLVNVLTGRVFQNPYSATFHVILKWMLLSRGALDALRWNSEGTTECPPWARSCMLKSAHTYGFQKFFNHCWLFA